MAIRRVIVHLGPAKCGSSTIQAFVLHLAEHDGGVTFHMPELAAIAGLDKPDPPPDAVDAIASLLASDAVQDTVLVLSQEMLFLRPRAVGEIIRLAAEHSDDVRVVGYSRRPSDFIQSAFCQWHFRSQNRLAEVRKAVAEIGLEGDAFGALERHFIAAIATDFRTAGQLSGKQTFRWGLHYDAIKARLARTAARLSVGQLPIDDPNSSLTKDFAQRCGGFTSNPASLPDERQNRQFDLDVVEAVSLAVERGLAMPGPHSEAALLVIMGRRMKKPDAPREQPLLDSLKDCADTLLTSESEDFAARYGLAAAAFRPRQETSKDRVMELLREEQRRRLANPLALVRERDRVLARVTEACVDLARILNHRGSKA